MRPARPAFCPMRPTPTRRRSACIAARHVTDPRVRRPAVRASWLREGGPATTPELRGKEPFVEVEWEARVPARGRDEIARVRRSSATPSIFGGSYGWASAGRFHHAQSQVHRFLNTVGGYVSSSRTSYSLGAAHIVCRTSSTAWTR